MKHFLLTLFLLFFSFSSVAQMKIVATYPPIQSMVLQITENVYPVSLLHKKGGQHHNVQLKPSQMKALQNADIVFWAGEELENYMPEAIKNVAPNALSVPLMTNEKLKIKQSVSNPEKKDPHFWLDIDNVIATLDKIEQVMSEQDPKNKDKFSENKQKALTYLNSLKNEAAIIPQNKKFVALHDGFDYFFEYFNLNGSTLGIDPENIKTPNQIQEFKNQIKSLNPNCIVVEPSFTRREKSGLGLNKYNIQKTDAFGWNINAGTSHLYKMMMWNIQHLKKCSE